MALDKERLTKFLPEIENTSQKLELKAEEN